jgi:hypothetical protein
MEIRCLSCHKLLDTLDGVMAEIVTFLGIKRHFNNIKIWTCNDIWHFVYITKDLEIIFEHKRDEATEEWKKLHNEEFNDLCSRPNIIRVTKSRITK